MHCAKGVAVFFNVLLVLKSLGYLFVAIVLILSLYSVATQLPPAVLSTLWSYAVAIAFGLANSSGGNIATRTVLVTAVCYVTLVLGALGLFLGIWGIVAAAKRNKCLLTTAAVLLVLILAIEVVFAVFMGLGSEFITDSNNANFTTTQVAKLPLATEVWIPLGILIGLGCITLFTFIFTICVCCVRGKEDYAAY